MRAADRSAERVALLVRVLPLLGDERGFALKGGTAINLFHRALLAAFKRGDPDWDLTGVPQVRDLPAVRWKQANLGRMTPSSRERAVERLEVVLGLPHQ